MHNSVLTGEKRTEKSEEVFDPGSRYTGTSLCAMVTPQPLTQNLKPLNKVEKFLRIQ